MSGGLTGVSGGDTGSSGGLTGVSGWDTGATGGLTGVTGGLTGAIGSALARLRTLDSRATTTLHRPISMLMRALGYGG